jgi:asparagine synthase (glutamine-hydrolysing)
LQSEFGIQENILKEEFLKILYQKKSKELPSLLEGDFAFVLEEDETYFCARDHLGIASFYYSFDGDSFISAGSLDALLRQLSFRPKADLLSMREFAWHNAMAPERTMYAGVFRLPPGHSMTVKHGQATIRRYWDPASIKTDYSISFDDAKKRFV